jgi:hypothetical protein
MILPRLVLIGTLVLLNCGCGEQRLMTVATVDDLSVHLSAFHRNPTEEEFRLILNSFARFDSNVMMRENASLMAAFVLFATERYGFSTDGVPSSQPLTRFRSADRLRFRTWLEDPGTSPEKNDVWWMAYCCTGEDRWLDHLLEVASTDRTSTGGKATVIDLAGSSAQWSYKSNTAQWEDVQRHAERHADLGNAFAKECVAYAKEHPELRQK